MAVKVQDVPSPHIRRRDDRADISRHGRNHGLALRVTHELVQLVPRTQPAARKGNSLRVDVQSRVVLIRCQPLRLGLLVDQQVQT